MNQLILIVFVFLFACTSFSEEETAVNTQQTAIKKVVVIDPGHGGSDVGVSGSDLVMEKDLALELARIIEKQLSRDYKTVMTRKSDVAVDLKKRSEAANRAQGDVMISLHVGANFNRNIRGIRLFHYTFEPFSAGDQTSVPDVALSSSSTVKWNEVQLQYISMSRVFAMILAEHIRQKISENPPGISIMGLPDIVLSGADMPALHVEIGQITNSNDEKLLKDKDYLAKLADGICSGIKAYLSQHPEKRVHIY